MKRFKRFSCALAACVMLLSLCLPASAANKVPAPAEWAANWAEISSSEGRMSITPGADETQMQFSWITYLSDSEEFIYGREPNLSDGVAAEVKTVKNTSLLMFVNRVLLTGLEPGRYYYTYTSSGKNQGIAYFDVQDASDGFSVMFCADPQLGRSGSDSEEAIIDDCYGWDRTLKASYAKAPDLSFVMVAGDQVNLAYSNEQYNAYLYPSLMSNLPVATAVGNHDFYYYLYASHFYNPNVREVEPLSMGGSGYYYSYGNALFIVLNSNNYLAEDHESLISEAINAYPQAKWRVVMLHNSVYCAGNDSMEMPVVGGELPMIGIAMLTPIFDKYDIDLALSGHYHIYSRSVPLTNGVEKSDGVVYLAASSASGSNYYAADAEKIPEFVDFYQNCSEPTYSILDIDDESIEIRSYGTDTGELFDTCLIEKAAAPGDAPSYIPSAYYAKIVEIVKMVLNILYTKIPFDFKIFM